MLYNGDNEIIQVYKGANLLDSAHSSSTKVWPTTLPTEPTITVNPGGTSVQVSAGKYKDDMGREFEFDTPRTLYLNPEGPVPAGSGIVSIPAEYSNWNSPANRKVRIAGYGGSPVLVNSDGTYMYLNVNSAGNGWEISTGYGSARATYSTYSDLTYTKRTFEGTTYSVEKMAKFSFYVDVYASAMSHGYEDDFIFQLKRNGVVVDEDVVHVKYPDSFVKRGGGGWLYDYKLNHSPSVSALLGWTPGTKTQISVDLSTARQKTADAVLDFDMYLYCSEAFVPGFIDGCYNMGMFYDEYSDNMYLYNMEVTEGTKFGVACVQSGVISSWSKS